MRGSYSTYPPQQGATAWSLADAERWVVDTVRWRSLSPRYDFATDWHIQETRLSFLRTRGVPAWQTVYPYILTPNLIFNDPL